MMLGKQGQDLPCSGLLGRSLSVQQRQALQGVPREDTAALETPGERRRGAVCSEGSSETLQEMWGAQHAAESIHPLCY